MTLVANDLGHAGSGGPHADSDMEAITVDRVLDHFTIAMPSDTVAGVPFSVTVTARDQGGNQVSNYGGTVNLTSTDGRASLPATASFTAGLGMFSATLKSAGNQTILVTDLMASITVQGVVRLDPAAPARLVFRQQPTTTLVNAPFLPPVSVVALDAFDNVCSNDNSDVVSVRLQSNPSGAALAGTSRVKLVNGVALFPTLRLSRAGSGFTLTAAALSLPAALATPFDVAAVASFSVTTPQTTTTAGAGLTVKVRALDATGRVVTNYAGKVRFTSSDPRAVLPADASLTMGQGSFPATLKTAGARTISVADRAKPSVRGTMSKPVMVTAAAVSALRVTGFPTPAVAGQKQMVTVSAVDSFGNVNAGYRGRVTWTSTDAAAVLPAPLTFKASDAGKHAFNITLKSAGLRAITATDGTLTARQANILVAGPSAAVVMQPDPDNPAKTALVVIGTAGKDVIDILPSNAAGTQLEVRINGASRGTAFAPTGHVLVYGLGGNDTIRLRAGTAALAGAAVAVPAVLDGGDGNDSIAAVAAANTILLGRAGDDRLTGTAVNDILIGGAGADVLHAGDGSDILSAGPTKLDANLAALLQLMAEWANTAASLLTRVQHLDNTLPGGANAPFFLNASTVQNDASGDQLFGDAGSDWYLFTGSGMITDQLKDPVSGEVLSGL